MTNPLKIAPPPPRRIAVVNEPAPEPPAHVSTTTPAAPAGASKFGQVKDAKATSQPRQFAATIAVRVGD